MIFKSVLAGAFGALWIASVAVAQTPTPSPGAPSPAALDRARHLMQTMHSDQTTDRMLATMQASIEPQMARSLPSDQQQRLKDLNDAIYEELRAFMPRLKDAMTAIYATDFTEQELADMDAFYASPTGQSVLAKLPMITQQLTPLVVAEMPALMSRAFDRFCDKAACTPVERGALSRSLKARTGQVGG